MEKLIAKLSKIRDDVDFLNCTNLITNGIIVSMDVIRIVGMIADEYEVNVPAREIKPANFDSAQAIYGMIERLSDE